MWRYFVNTATSALSTLAMAKRPDPFRIRRHANAGYASRWLIIGGSALIVICRKLQGSRLAGQLLAPSSMKLVSRLRLLWRSWTGCTAHPVKFEDLLCGLKLQSLKTRKALA